MDIDSWELGRRDGDAILRLPEGYGSIAHDLVTVAYRDVTRIRIMQDAGSISAHPLGSCDGSHHRALAAHGQRIAAAEPQVRASLW
jgi:hypothetical protein